jgi:hypothetical protein
MVYELAYQTMYPAFLIWIMLQILIIGPFVGLLGLEQSVGIVAEVALVEFAFWWIAVLVVGSLKSLFALMTAKDLVFSFIPLDSVMYILFRLPVMCIGLLTMGRAHDQVDRKTRYHNLVIIGWIALTVTSLLVHIIYFYKARSAVEYTGTVSALFAWILAAVWTAALTAMFLVMVYQKGKSRK